MSDATTMLKHCCRGLASDRLKERRESASQLRDLLNNEQLCALLDAGGRDRDQLTWTYVLASVITHFQKEMTKAEGDARAGKNAATREQLKKMYQLVVDAVDERSHRSHIVGGAGATDHSLPRCWVRLFSRVAYLLFEGEDTVLDITQVPSGSTSDGRPAKRRRLESMMRRRVARPGRLFLELYLQRAAPPSAPAVRSLVEFLRGFAVPQPAGPAADRLETRATLIDWLLTAEVEARAVAEALARLVLRDNTAELALPACDAACRAAALLRLWCDCGLLSAAELASGAAPAGSLRALTTSLLLAAAGELDAGSPSVVAPLLGDLRDLFATQAAACLRLVRDDTGRLVPPGRRDESSGLTSGSSSGQIDVDFEILETTGAAEAAAGDDCVLEMPLHELEQARLLACTMLTTFVTMDTADKVELSEGTVPGEVISALLDAVLDGRLQVGFPGDARIAMHLLTTLPSAGTLNAGHVGSFSELLLLVCREWPRDARVNRAVLDVMAGGYVQLVGRLGSDRDRTDAMKFTTVMQRKAEMARFGERGMLSHLRLLAALPVFEARERQPAADGATPPLDDMFSLVYTAGMQCVAPAGAQLDELSRLDDAPNRAAVSRLHDVPAEMVLRALRHLAAALGLASPRRLLAAHLDFVVARWLAVPLRILEFPHRLLEYSSPAEFLTAQLGCVTVSVMTALFRGHGARPERIDACLRYAADQMYHCSVVKSLRRPEDGLQRLLLELADDVAARVYCALLGLLADEFAHLERMRLFVMRDVTAFLLADADVAVVRAAGYALRAVLADPGGARALKLLAATLPGLAEQLHPFQVTRRALPRPKPLPTSEALRMVDSPALWMPEHGEYEPWLLELTVTLLAVGVPTSPELAAYAPLCRVKGADFCRELLPYATRAVLLSNKELRAAVSRWVNGLLQEHRSLRQRESSAVASTPTPTPATAPSLAADPRCLQTLLDVVLYLRRQPLPGGEQPDWAWERHFWLDLRLPAAACAALRCGRFCEAVLLAEVSCYAEQRGDRPLLDRSPESEELRALLREAHVQLGDVDGVAALRSGGGDARGQLVHLEQQEEWLRSLSAYDGLAAERTAAVQSGMLRCLAELELFSTAQTQLRGLTVELGHPDTLPAHLLEASCELQLAQLRVLYAGWLSEVHAESPQAVLKQHLAPAIEQLERYSAADGVGAEGALLDAHHLVGQYADVQFQRVDEIVSSPAFADKRAEATRMREEAEEFQRHSADATKPTLERKDLARQRQHLLRSAELDESELRQHEEERASFQRQAVASYVRCLQLGDRRDLLMYRVVALWLADESDQVCKQLGPAAPRLASHKFVPLLQQLAARLGRPRWHSGSAELLQQLLERCASDHPHHTLPRTAAATRLVARLRERDALADHVRQLEAASRALIQLANHVHNGGGSSQGRVPAACGLPLDALPAVAVQTVPLPVRPDGDYTAAASVVRWDDKFSMVGGLNAPKKLRCLGSDGRWRPQLLKGRDDLRQDAVMQQVFSVLNLLLAESAAPGQQRLAIRTYKVVPLSQRSGLIEWCVDTQPLAEYLTGGGRGGAHERYRPDDMTTAQARAAMTAAAKKTPESKRRAFDEVCARLRPVFRHFFLERFPEPCAWFERRFAYTNSVATSSISGYVLGLGDRHVSNILIDQASAEVVHIDLGVAFDTGRLLPTPETVPFRLTRDLVDGMGVAGVEGRFRRSCERTLAVLRESRQLVLTIVRVLLDDPLYAWTLTADKMARLQQRRVKRVVDNRQAERALARLDEKLRGQEMGRLMDCAAQVGHLIQQARDPDNLCRLFSGWQAYL
ncbi:serine-protein kinase ATM-like [Pollicipes pollicipes]|uniref:serine-protein kinase ATM-like n=1 Tax=Pollicipes pollicipes TaxID=41117 RepID=UPI001884CCBE|nr:serine-protein kinase ATM-like [Pollicipes pollicipes]